MMVEQGALLRAGQSNVGAGMQPDVVPLSYRHRHKLLAGN
jgi:hypothetical protein